jgi:hypothetical protein
MIAHIVLFRPRAEVGAIERAAFERAIAGACREIPSIRRFRLGPRVRHGRAYEATVAQDYPYAAVIEFDDLAGLSAYLDHPAHAELARLWASTSADSLVFDYELAEASTGGTLA